MQQTTETHNNQATSTAQSLSDQVEQVDYEVYFTESNTTIAQGDDSSAEYSLISTTTPMPKQRTTVMPQTTETHDNSQATPTTESLSDKIEQVDYALYFTKPLTTIAQGDDFGGDDY